MPSERHVAELKALAITHLEEAAEARGLGAMAEAGAHLLVAIQHTDDPAIRARLQSAAAWAMSDSGDYERAISLAQAATDTFDALGDPVAAGDAAAAHGSALTRTGNSAAAAAIVEPRWHALCDEVGADRTLVQLAYILGRAMGRDWPGEHFWLDRRTLVSERLGDPAEISAAWRALSVHFVYAGAPATGMVLLEAAVGLARDHHLPRALTHGLINLASSYNLVDLERAVRVGREALDSRPRRGGGGAGSADEPVLGLLAAGEWDEVLADRWTDTALPMETSLSAVCWECCAWRAGSRPPWSGRPPPRRTAMTRTTWPGSRWPRPWTPCRGATWRSRCAARAGVRAAVRLRGTQRGPGPRVAHGRRGGDARR